ncbi:MAG: glycosyltransferase family 2 protein [Victivallaceae bacterium]|nr:glycosyltransferase family 2 protein [Victivallaceae bacterium]
MASEIYIIIPCYNESHCIADTLRELLIAVPAATLVVVNDASTDRSSEAVRGVDDRRIVLLELPFNLGIGGAVKTGLVYALRHGARVAVKFDGDGQHPADGVAALLKPLERGELDLAVGSRFMLGCDGFKSTAPRRVGIAVLCGWIHCIAGVKVRDCTSGFRAYNRAALEFAAQHYPAFDYPEPEELVLFARNGFRIGEIGVVMRERQGGISSIGPVRAAYYMVKVMLAAGIAAIRPVEKAVK